MSTAWQRWGGRFSHRTVRALLWSLLVLVLAITANLAGIYLIGSVEGWRQWMANTRGGFLIWRLCLYGATLYGWRWMRGRLRVREPDRPAQCRLRRTGIAGGMTIAALEISRLFQSA